jgi:Rrf2 family protein
MLSHTSDYALRAILVLAGDKQQRLLRADEIADATGAPRNYMGKTLNSLVKAGVLTSARGPQGGFSLAIPAEELTIARVVDCFVDPRPHRRCLLGNRPCDPEKPCAAHATWAAINTQRRDPLATTTVADLLNGARNQKNSPGEQQ